MKISWVLFCISSIILWHTRVTGINVCSGEGFIRFASLLTTLSRYDKYAGVFRLLLSASSSFRPVDESQPRVLYKIHCTLCAVINKRSLVRGAVETSVGSQVLRSSKIILCRLYGHYRVLQLQRACLRSVCLCGGVSPCQLYHQKKLK